MLIWLGVFTMSSLEKVMKPRFKCSLTLMNPNRVRSLSFLGIKKCEMGNT